MKKANFEFWFDFWVSPLGLALREALRWGVLAVISHLLLLLPQLNQSFDIVTLTAVLRFIDAALHKSGIAERGIVRF